MRIGAALLESYERQIQSVEGALKVTTHQSFTCQVLLTHGSPFIPLLCY